MGHHIPPVLPPVLQPPPKLEKSRWRPKVWAKAGQQVESGLDGVGEAGEAYAVEAAHDQVDAHAVPGRSGAAASQARLGGVTAQALTDDTLRTLLAGQERLVAEDGALDRSA